MNIIQLRNEIPAIKAEIVKRFNDQCYVCSFNCTPILAVHHIHHLSLGGNNSQDNLVLLCPNCHAIVHKMIKEINLHDEIDIFNMSSDLRIISNWITDNLGQEAEGKLISIARQERMIQNARNETNF